MINRIEELKKFLGISTRAFAIKCGINQPTLDRMLKGINALNLNCVASILESFPNVSAEWLMRGNGEMFLSNEPDATLIDRVSSLLDTISALTDTISQNKETISSLQDKVRYLESRLKA